MKKVFILLIAVSIIFGLAGSAYACDSGDHQVTVDVSTIHEIAVAGGDITLTIDTATAGKQPNKAVDKTCNLYWTINETGYKITVGSSLTLAEQNYTLKVRGKNVKGGTAAGEVTLCSTVADFITAPGSGKFVGGCKLKYTAQATAAAGTGQDVHTITYTIQATSP